MRLCGDPRLLSCIVIHGLASFLWGLCDVTLYHVLMHHVTAHADAILRLLGQRTTLYNVIPILSSIANLVDAGLLRAHVSHRFALEEVAEGHRQVETARTIGKVANIVRR